MTVAIACTPTSPRQTVDACRIVVTDADLYDASAEIDEDSPSYPAQPAFVYQLGASGRSPAKKLSMVKRRARAHGRCRALHLE